MSESMTHSLLDLHTHTTASDGIYAPAELMRLAHAAGLKRIGVVDHDSTNGLAEAIAAAEQYDITVVPGVEINTDLPGHGGEVHVLGYYVEYKRPAFQQALDTLRDARERRGERMVERLREQGFDVSWERVRELAHGAVGRPHVAAALIERGYASNVSDAFDKFLSPGRPGYVPRYKLAPADAVRLIKSARGVPVLAHPLGIPAMESEVLPELVIVGLQGLECYYGQYSESDVTHLLDLADTYRLVPTGGSDYHGPGMHPTPLGGRYVPMECAERLERLATFNHQIPAPTFDLPSPNAESGD